MGAGRDIAVTVIFDASASDEAVTDAWSLVVAFQHLARSGALCGAALAPWNSGMEAVDNGPRSDNSATWIMRKVAVDDLAVTILSQLFLLTHRNHPIRRVLIHDNSGVDQLTALSRVETDEAVYPRIFSPLAPRVKISPHFSEDIAVEVQFAGALSEQETVVVREHLENCIAAIAVGCYPIAPLPPDKCGVEYDGRIRFFEEWVDFGLASLRAHPDALNGLCNALFAALGKSRELLSIEIE